MNNKEGVEIPIGYKNIVSRELFACESPNVLYHYTDYDGAKGIIESRSLRLTKLSYLNDISELKLAIELFKTNAVEWAKKINEGEKKELLDKTACQLQNFENINICVASFCENGDLLSQWRSYGNGGSCVALGFNAKLLKGLSNTGRINLLRCVYSPHEHREIIDDLINILLNSYDIISSKREHVRDWEEKKWDLICYFNTTFLSVAPVIKDSSFSEEKEWRIITTPMPLTDKNWFSMIGNNRVSQYYKLIFNEVFQSTDEVLKEIIIGPTQEPKLVSDAFWALLHKAGYKTTLRHSQIPYRAK